MAVGVTIVALTASAGGTDDPASQLRVFSSSSARPSAEAIETLKSSGVDIAQGDSATTIAAPSGDGQWTIGQSADRACLLVPGGISDAVTCGTTTQLRSGGTLGFVPDERAAASLGMPATAKDAPKRGPAVRLAPQNVAPGGTATFRGLAANDVVQVAIVGTDGKVLASTKAQNSVYELVDVPFAAAAAVQFTRADGQATLTPIR